MGLDIYVGSLTRYFVGDWELITQTVARELGHEVRIIRPHPEPEDAIRNPDQVRPIVERWRATLSESLSEHLSQPLDWDESSKSPYFTDKPTWDCYNALVLWAAYDEQPHLKRPVGPVADLAADPAYSACTDQTFESRYSQILQPSIWLPNDFRFQFNAGFVGGDERTFGSSRELAWQLDDLNRRTWNTSQQNLKTWRSEGADHGVPLETSARFAFSIFKTAADQSVLYRLPMLMDW